MIDTNARNILTQKQMNKELVDEIKASLGKNIQIPDPTSAIQAVQSEMVSQQKATRDLLAEIKKVGAALQELTSVEKDTNTQIKEDKTLGLQEEIAKSAKNQETGVGWLHKLHTTLTDFIASTKEFKKSIPTVFPVMGTVEVSKVTTMPALEVTRVGELPPLNIENFPKQLTIAEMRSLFEALQATIYKGLQDAKVDIPRSTTIDSIKSEVSIKQWGELLDAMEELKKGFNLLLNKEAGTLAFPKSSIPVEIQNWKVAQPVTHISLNALQGFVKTTSATVGTTLTSLPSYGQLFNRRAIMVYNNSSNTIYVGGSDVTVSEGMPVPSHSYSPILDLGYNSILYGIAATNNNNVRVIEVSDEASGR